jgi:pimeloyl-ACP methyl ester carboxylesterase
MGVEGAEGARGVLSPGSEVVVVEGTGHFLHLERPGEVNARIVEFLRA